MAKSNRLFFDSSQEVSGVLSLALVFLLAFIVAWFSVTAGQNIVDYAKNSPSFVLQAQTLNDEIHKK